MARTPFDTIAALKELLDSLESPTPAEDLRLSALRKLLAEDYMLRGFRSAARADSVFETLISSLGDITATEISERIVEYITRRKAAGIRPATLHYDVSILRRSCRIAVERGLLGCIPWMPSISVGDNAPQGLPPKRTLQGAAPARSHHREMLEAPPRRVRLPFPGPRHLLHRKLEPSPRAGEAYHHSDFIRSVVSGFPAWSAAVRPRPSPRCSAGIRRPPCGPRQARNRRAATAGARRRRINRTLWGCLRLANRPTAPPSPNPQPPQTYP
jgi:hypothetical protein